MILARRQAQSPLNSVSCRSLNVFHREPHPSSFKAGGYKEGLSIFSILNHTKVSREGRREGGGGFKGMLQTFLFPRTFLFARRQPAPGKIFQLAPCLASSLLQLRFHGIVRLLRQWLMQPLQDVKDIGARQVWQSYCWSTLRFAHSTLFSAARMLWNTSPRRRIKTASMRCRGICVTSAILACVAGSFILGLIDINCLNSFFLRTWQNFKIAGASASGCRIYAGCRLVGGLSGQSAVK